MASRRKKSIRDVENQFERIWRGSVEQSDVYKRMRENSERRGWNTQEDKDNDFKMADRVLRSNEPSLTERDRQLNKRINDADRVATRYKTNLQRKGGFSDLTPYYANGERMEAYYKHRNKKFSYSARAGVSG